jgi:hypothetical protein
MADFDDRSGRDTRLLALVIVIAIAVLVGLARFRFSQTDARPVAVTPGPLERLAARATYDDLAAAVHTALQRVEPALILVTLEPDAQARPAAGRDASAAAPRRVLGVRLDGDWAVVHLPPGYRIVRTSPDDPLTVRRVDAAREIAVISRPPSASEDKLPAGIGELSGFAYVSVVEPTDDGPTMSPVFVGRVRSVFDERWNDNLIVPGGSSELVPGALVFQLDGRFLGLAVRPSSGRVSIAPAALLESIIAAVRSSGEHP